MAIGIDPTVDFAFKRLLGSPEHSRITVHFLNAVLGASPRITDVTILNPFLAKDFEEDKLSVLDVLATDEHGRRLNVEMQTSLPIGMRKRLAFYASSLYVDQLTEGRDYALLQPAVNICVLDAVMFPDVVDLHLDFRLRDDQYRETLTDDMQIHTIELPKYQRPVNNEVITDPLEKWVYFLRFATSSTASELSARLVDDEFGEAVGVLEMISKSQEERMLYQARLKFQRDEQARLKYAEQEGRAKGEAEGRAKGEAEGRAEGRAEGEARGEQIGRIRFLLQLLGKTELSHEEFAEMDLPALEAMAADLQCQLPSNN